MNKKYTLLLVTIAAVSLHTATAQSWNLTGNSTATTSSKLGTTNSIPLRFYTNNTQRVTITTDGKMGVNITAPPGLFTVQSNGSVPNALWAPSTTQPVFFGFSENLNADFSLAAASNDPKQRPLFFGKRSRGTLASPSAVKTDDYLTSMAVYAYDGSAFQIPATIDFYADGTPGSGKVPARISFVTGSNAGNRLERLKIGNTGNIAFNNTQLTVTQSDGRVGIGTASPAALLDIKGDILINNINAGHGAANISSNTAFGFGTLSRNTTGSYNTGSGYSALTYNTTGLYNTAFGGFAQVSVTSANYNTSVGMYSLYYDSTTGSNTAIGLSAGDYTYNPTQGTFLGASSYAGANLTNMTAIGYNSVVSASNSVRVGNSYVTSIGGQVGWSTFSDGRFKKNIEENVPGLAFINKLRPVTYNLNMNDIDSKLQEIVQIRPRNNSDKLPERQQLSAAEIKAKEDKAKIKYTGFLAQEVEAAAKSVNYDFSGVDAPKNDKDFYGLRYDEFIMPLVKSVQELSKQNDELKKTNADLETRLAKLEGLLNVSNPATTRQTASLTSATLDQNIPNPPANNSTRINYNIPMGSLKAALSITDNSGKKVKQITLNNSGKGVLNVNTAGLASGTYSYSLYVDGKLVETKSMVIINR